MIPPLLLGIALLITIDLFHLVPSLGTVSVGHILYVLPFVIVIVAARLRTLDPEIELAARDLGAGVTETVRRITLPVVAPAVVAAAAVAFAFSFDEILITTFTSGLEPTLPLYVVSRLRRTIDPSVNAVAFILMAVPWIALGVGALFLRGRLFATASPEKKGKQ
jgi:spermidine/putrescine transport system permease protein